MKQIFCKPQFLWGILLGLCYYFGQSHVVLAHADLVEASPAPGDVLSEAPQEIRLEFNEEVDPSSTFTVFDQAFRTIPIIVETNAQTGQILVGRDLEISQPGVYTVQWLVISQDGHPIEGSYAFEVNPDKVGGLDHMELVAAAESTAVNLPGWFAWIMVGLAIVVPFLVRSMTQNS